MLKTEVSRNRVTGTDLLRIKTNEYFTEYPKETFFVVVGTISGRFDDLLYHVSEELSIPNNNLKFVRYFPLSANAQSIVNEAVIPGCIGIVVFGMNNKKKQALEPLLERSGINGEYVIFDDTSKVIKRASLVNHLRKLLELFFSNDE